MEKNLIINQKGIEYKLKRIAYQILEDYADEKAIELIGIYPNGESLAKDLKQFIEKIGKVKVNLHSIHLNKKEPLSEAIKLSTETETLENKHLILIDDVANTGKTSFYAFKPLLEIEVKSVKMAVLIERKHKQYPISNDYVGTALNTTIQEYISVAFENGKATGVYLS